MNKWKCLMTVIGYKEFVFLDFCIRSNYEALKNEIMSFRQCQKNNNLVRRKGKFEFYKHRWKDLLEQVTPM